MVEPQPSKLMMRVRFPLPAPDKADIGIAAHIAQSVEHFLGKEEVTGSNPVMSSSLLPALAGADAVMDCTAFGDKPSVRKLADPRGL